MSGDIIWVSYCTTCHKELEACPNGVFAQGAAIRHMREEGNHDHKVLVGYYEEVKP